MNIKKKSIVRLLSYIKPYWYLVLLSSVFGVLKLILPLILPQVLKYFTDTLLISETLTASEKINEIIKWLMILLMIYSFIYIPAAFLRQTCAMQAGNRITHTMRCQLYSHLQKMSASFHHKNKSGNIVTRISSDVDSVYTFIWNVATNVWIDFIMFVIYITLMFSINVPLTLICAVAVPLSVIITKKIRGQIYKASKKVQNNISEISGYTQERMAGFATIKLFNMENYEINKFNKYSEKIYCFIRKTNRYSSLGEAVTGSLSEITVSIIVCLSAVYIVKDTMTIGDLIIFYSYLGYFITPLRRFAELNLAYSKSIAGIERVFEILDTPIDIKEKRDALTLDYNAPVNINFSHLYFKYNEEDENYTLYDIDFSIRQGENIALVGSSGCGKTTLVSILTRFYDPDEGSVIINGTDIRDYSLKSLYEKMGMVFQDTLLFSGTIKENLLYGKPNAADKEIEDAAKAANAYDFIMNTPKKFDTLLGERGIGLSGGQKQRIAIARVFLKNPKLLILDEATSALDSESEELVQDALENLMKDRTSIVIAHRLSTIVNADKIIVMEHGKIVEMGNHTELLEKGGRYFELYNMQFKDIIKDHNNFDCK